VTIHDESPRRTRPAERVFDNDEAKSLALFVGDSRLGNADLSNSSRTHWDRQPVVEWSSRYGRSPYFFFGPLLAIGGLGVDFAVLLPPLFDIGHLSGRSAALRG